MTLFRVEHNKNYTVVNNYIITDNQLSWKAKGIWLYAFSRPEDWQFYLSDLIQQSTDGREAVSSGLKELQEAGYLIRIQIKNDDGSFGRAEWTFFETPKSQEDTHKLKNKVPQTGFTVTVKPTTENQPLLNTDKNKVLKENNNAKPKVSLKGVPKERVVAPSLENVHIEKHLKEKLTEDYEDEKINQAVESLIKSTDEIDNIYGWLKKCIERGGYSKPTTPEEKKEKNYQWSLKNLKNTYTSPHGQVVKCEITRNYVEFSFEDSIRVVYIKLDDSKFNFKINEYLSKLK